MMPVVLIGAGPAGLSTAWSLLRSGVPPASVRLVDARPNPIDGLDSRALGIHARTLEALGPALAARLVARGRAARSFSLCDGGGGQLLSLDVDAGSAAALTTTAFPFVLCLSQGAFEAELRGALAEKGVEVEWGVRFAGLVEEEEAGGGGGGSGRSGSPAATVTARLERVAAGGGEKNDGLSPAPLPLPLLVRAAFLVGCDGVRSAVRAAAGLEPAAAGAAAARAPFSFLADVELAGPGLEAVLSRPHAFLGRGGATALSIPLERPGWARLVFSGGPAAAEKGDGARPSLDESGVRALFDARIPFAASWKEGGGGGGERPGGPPPPSLAGAALAVAAVGWTSAFRVVEHLAPSFRSSKSGPGRGLVFLAGDAAHAHAPTGGQGLNLGVGDGANLGFKLALSLLGGSGSEGVPAVPDPEPLLASYSAERRPVAAARVRATGLAWRVLVEARAAPLVALRNGLLRLVGASPRATARLAAAAGPAVTMLGIRYAADGVVLAEERGTRWARGAPGPGWRAPLGVGGLADELEAAGGRHLLVVWGGSGSGEKEEEEEGGPPPQATPLPWARVWRAASPALVAALGGDTATPGAAVVVRPDGVIGWRGRGVPGAAAWWARLVGAR